MTDIQEKYLRETLERMARRCVAMREMSEATLDTVTDALRMLNNKAGTSDIVNSAEDVIPKKPPVFGDYRAADEAGQSP